MLRLPFLFPPFGALLRSVADDACLEGAGVVFEATAAGASRTAVLSPADARGAMTLSGNRGGDWAV
jgi:hypothetical protein